ncbi:MULTISPECIES: RagB/SusD family nutrient uptake outer membrane protein [Butyricimonas]|uniref:RagB/SusD family nutrient uptake outer membrane protein n=1 Tax=Butyricimonas TaxID=574697 RepID=UPI0007FB29DC|nr:MULTISPECIES: RagB/SusD family nutrient uptake outer membrane protein [Butyricimonas]
MKRLLYFLIPLFFFSACDSWLDIVPEEDMTTLDTEFETRNEAENWLRSCYMFLQTPVPSIAHNEAFLGADEFVVSDNVYDILGPNQKPYFVGLMIANGMQNSLEPYNDRWLKKEASQQGQLEGRSDFYTAINMCNIFINKIDQVYNLEAAGKRERKGEVMALKAYYYFELVRRYGPIILVPENIDPNVNIQAMKVPRSHVDTCFNAIVKLCDDAAAILSPFNQKETSRRAYFCKEAALALKARALAYQASDLFNGNPDYRDFRNKNGEPLFSATKDQEKWRRAAQAAKEAIDVCLDNGKRLVKGKSGTSKLLADMKNIEGATTTFGFASEEALLMVKPYGSRGEFFERTLPRTKTGESFLQGTCISPSMKMVEMFYTDNGLPIDQDPTYGAGNPYQLVKVRDPKYTNVVMMDVDIPYLHTRREPRFYADIAADRTCWQLGLTTEQLYKVEVYQGEEFGLKENRLNSLVPQNRTGYFLKKWIYSNCALHNYSSDLSSLGVRPFPAIRMAELYLLAAEAYNEIDERKVACEYLNEVRARAGIPDVEDSWAMAKDKNKVKTQSGLREIIRQEWNIEFAFEGMRFWNLRRWKTAHVELNNKLRGWVVTGADANSFYNNGKGPVIVSSKNKFVAPRDYFWPIQSDETMTSGCVQNLGW